MSISSAQVRAARLLLKWSRLRLAGEAGVSETAISAFEEGKKRPPLQIVSALQGALASAGVEFLVEHGGRGVRLRKAP